ncbi:hypothetical protein JDV02_005758 [Purpureocillium takamizusanense]|uniref:D-lactate dehydratase n=1 Tax=Purpureocillium takamizusanense TaxID=2060973 RepID=A0A9Q8VC67_9HYPO|nr:uncharacterized protein JDV02_005758 [Purpureocillium takamizusanense]UNI19579.1 hypothetical protein JDV02_005758 [Purpureocillium takamizusanense]
MANPKILVVLTSHDEHTKLPGQKTGWYLPELSHPHAVLHKDFEIVSASPKGGKAPLDPGSAEAFASDPESKAFLENHAHVFEQTRPLSEFLGRSGEFAALFYPGGHGPMYDLYDHPDSIALIEEFDRAGKPVAAVCHGPIVLAKARRPDGRPLVQGRRATGFTNKEEDMVELTQHMPVLLEDEFKKAGALWEAADPWAERVVVDGNIITGQNPASARRLGEELAKAVRAQQQK